MADREKTWVFLAVINPPAAKTNSKTCQGGDRAAATPGTAPPGPLSAAKPGSAAVIFSPHFKKMSCVCLQGPRGLCKSLERKGNTLPGSTEVKSPSWSRARAQAGAGEGAHRITGGASPEHRTVTESPTRSLAACPPTRHRSADGARIWVIQPKKVAGVFSCPFSADTPVLSPLCAPAPWWPRCQPSAGSAAHQRDSQPRAGQRHVPVGTQWAGGAAGRASPRHADMPRHACALYPRRQVHARGCSPGGGCTPKRHRTNTCSPHPGTQPRLPCPPRLA